MSLVCLFGASLPAKDANARVLGQCSVERTISNRVDPQVLRCGAPLLSFPYKKRICEWSTPMV